MTKEHAPAGNDSTLATSAVPSYPTPTPHIDLVGRSLLHFRVLGRLGAGGMGVVYKAFDEKLRRTVALKVLGPRYVVDDRNKELILHEARSAAGLNHPNIASIYELHETAEGAFYVMELVDGETLRARIAHARLPIDLGLRLAMQIARALAHAHEAGIVHRDLKSDNVMITRAGDIKLLDFGLAKVVALAQLTATSDTIAHDATAVRGTIGGHGRVVGTPSYMAPEQARGEDVDARADVFAFGVVLYEMLTGALPFAKRAGLPSGDSTSGDWKIAVPFSKLVPRAPRAIEPLVQRCLAFDGGARYANGAALVRVLEPILATQRHWKRYAAAIAVPLVAVGLYIALRSGNPPGAITYRAQRVTTRGDIRLARLAPDGHHVAALAGNEVLLFDLDAPDKLRVLATATPTTFEMLSWSSDGRHLVYDGCCAPPSGTIAIKVIALDGSPSTDFDSLPLMVAVGPASYASWSPRRKEVIFSDLPGDHSHVLHCPIPGTYSAIDTVTAATADDDVYITTKSEHVTVYRTDRTCSHVDVIAAGIDGTSTDETSTALTGDGASLLVVVDRGDQPHVIAIDHDGMHDISIAVQPPSTVAGQRPDGTFILINTSVSWRLVRVALDGATAELASGVTRNVIDVSSDGARFARIDAAGCQGGPLAIVDFARPTELKRLEANALGVGWSPDGRRLAVLVAVGAARALVVEDADGGHRSSRSITDVAVDACEGLHVTWLGTDAIAYLKLGDRTFRRVELASGATSDLFDASLGVVFRARPSPVGATLVAWWNRKQGQGLWLVEPGRGERLLSSLPADAAYAWSPAGDAIFTVGGSDTAIERIDVATGTTSLRATLPSERNVVNADLFARPDGDLIVERELSLSDLVTQTPSR